MNREAVNNYIIQINRSGSLTGAAKALHISQPALSMSLNQLEKELGFSIFNRKASPLTLTESGSLYMEYLTRKHLLESEYLDKIGDLDENSHIRVRTGAPSAYIDSVLAPAAVRLYEEIPGLQMEIKTGTVSELMEMTEAAETDCFISTSEITSDGFTSILLKNESTFLCIPDSLSCDLRKNEKKVTDYHILDDQNIIFLKSALPMQRSIDSLIKREKLNIKHTFTVDQISTSLALVNLGAGICFASGDAVNAYRGHKRFRALPIDDRLFDRSIYVAFLENRYMSKAVKKFINILSKERTRL